MAHRLLGVAFLLLTGCAMTKHGSGSSAHGGAGGAGDPVLDMSAEAGATEALPDAGRANAGTAGETGSGGSADAGSSGGTGGMAGEGAAACSYLAPPRGQVLLPVEPIVATACTSTSAAFPDACACDGLSCPAGETCLRVVQRSQFGVGGPDQPYNGCFAVCAGDDECTAPDVCVGNSLGVAVCAFTACRSSSDCTSDPGGTCAPIFIPGHAGAVHPAGMRCIYAGACDAQSCAGCSGEQVCHTCP